MIKKKRSIEQKILVILAIAMLLNFVGGGLLLLQLERGNLRYFYQQTGELMAASMRETETQTENLQNAIYRMAVADDVQSAGSVLIGEGDAVPTMMQQASALDDIVDSIQKEMSGLESIVCANYIDQNGQVRVIATRHYYKLDAEQAEYVEECAVAAEGKTICIDAGELTGDDTCLIMAKQVREKKSLSLKHIGVIVLYVDVETLGSALMETHTGIVSMQTSDGQIGYVLNTEGVSAIDEELPGLDAGDDSQNYEVIRIGDEKYFVVAFVSDNGFFTYTLYVPYQELFGNLEKSFILYLLVFVATGVAIMVAAFWLTHHVTRDIRSFIDHIGNISWENFTQLPCYENERTSDRDVYELQEAFNTMSTRINKLVLDNYEQQLLLKETQLQALQSQMNPHFLYNTLNSLYWMVKTAGISAAADMITSLGILLREAISDREYVITMDRELDLVCHYLIIQKHRYEERLEISFDIAEECSSNAVPKFAIQPLVENAITYGLECMLEPCRIEIRVYARDGVCICQVRNDGPEPAEDLIDKLEKGLIQPQGHGVGLLNIQRRIQSVFGEKYGVCVYREDRQTVAQISMENISLEEYLRKTDGGSNVQNRDRG